MKQIKSLEELKQLAIHNHNFVIRLNKNLTSSKWIEYHEQEKKFYVYNYIDDTSAKYTEKQLAKQTNIVKAINIGSLYME